MDGEFRPAKNLVSVPELTPVDGQSRESHFPGSPLVLDDRKRMVVGQVCARRLGYSGWSEADENGCGTKASAGPSVRTTTCKAQAILRFASAKRIARCKYATKARSPQARRANMKAPASLMIQFPHSCPRITRTVRTLPVTTSLPKTNGTRTWYFSRDFRPARLTTSARQSGPSSVRPIGWPFTTRRVRCVLAQTRLRRGAIRAWGVSWPAPGREWYGRNWSRIPVRGQMGSWRH
jgi:hypothetical protein